MSAGISTIKTKFEYSTSETFTSPEEIYISSYPDIRGASNSIDSTTMNDTQYTSIPGLKGSNDSMDFNANYDKEKFHAIDQLTEAVWQRLTLADCSGFKWKGKLEVSNGTGEVNGLVTMVLHSFKEGDAEHFVSAT